MTRWIKFPVGYYVYGIAVDGVVRIIVALSLMIGVVVQIHAQENPPTHGSFTVKSAPSGSAPQSVRDGWIGLTLPFDEIILCNSDIFGKLQDPSILSYVVSQETALNLLKSYSPESFRWWNENGFPSSSFAGFCFSTEPLVG
jgi:hypothetical protein